MKTLLLTAAATALIFAAPTAFAQDDHHHAHPGGGDAHETHAAAPARTTHAAAPAHTTHAAAPAHTTHAAPLSHAATSGPAMTGPTRHSHHGMTTTTSSPTPPPGWTVKGQGHAANRMRENNSVRSNNAMRGNAMRGGNSHANFNRRNVTASHHYHYRGGAYHGPSGYSYHRYSYGETFPSIYFGQNYWIDDYSDYGLAYPPPGCVWVRYGDDAVLVEQDNGEILEVVYGQFD